MMPMGEMNALETRIVCRGKTGVMVSKHAYATNTSKWELNQKPKQTETGVWFLQPVLEVKYSPN
jgi:hypothetical protein